LHGSAVEVRPLSLHAPGRRGPRHQGEARGSTTAGGSSATTGVRSTGCTGPATVSPRPTVSPTRGRGDPRRRYDLRVPGRPRRRDCGRCAVVLVPSTCPLTVLRGAGTMWIGARQPSR
jgi:hypothetical protein